MRLMALIVGLIGLTMYASDTVDEFSFEVASVKSFVPEGRVLRSGCTGGPGTSSPGTWSCPRITLEELILRAYDLELYQWKPPEWMMTSWIRVIAKLPAGATPDQFEKMQRSLLRERFKLAFHHQPKEQTVFELKVAKTGLKMRESPLDASDAEVEWRRVPRATIGPDQFPVFPPGVNGLMGVNEHERWRSSNVTLANIVKILRREMASDVVDGTGLTGKYDVDIRWQKQPIEYFPAAPPFVGPSIEKAIQDALGLRLEAKKGTVNVVVIDHIERSPTEN